MSTAADLFAQSLVDMVRSTKDRQRSERELQQIEAAVAAWNARIQEGEEANAANLAEKYALRQQLERYCPDHPLLKNKQLIEKIQNLGVRAFAMNRNYDDARNVGESYFPPGTPPLGK